VAVLQSEYTGGKDARAVIAVASNAAVADPLAVAFYGLELSTPQPFIGYETPRAETWFPAG